jgi:hypothetical protein
MGLRMLAAEVGIVLMGIVHMAGIVEGAADGRAAVGEIVDAAGAADGLVAAGGIVGAAGLAGGDTNFHEFSWMKDQRPRCESWPFLVWAAF